MLSIKLSRVGKKKSPSYRVLVLEKSKDPWGNFLENVGFYNPKAKPKVVELKAERIKHWISVGAQPTDTVHNLLITQGIITEKKRTASKISKKRTGKMEEKKKENEAKAAEVAEVAKAEAAKPAEEPQPEAEKAEVVEATPAEAEAPKPEADAPQAQKVEEVTTPAEALESKPEAEEATDAEMKSKAEAESTASDEGGEAKE